MKALSMFSGVGIGEYYLKEIGINVVVANEISKSRATAHTFFYPDCKMIVSDITENQTKQKIIEESKALNVNLIIVTPPCQGLSTAGRNKTEEALYGDPRNHLILSSLEVVDAILPEYFIIENVPRFQQMRFSYMGNQISLLDLLTIKFGKKYEIDCNVFNAADYGVPQTRLRVVYRIWKKGLKWALSEKQQQITLREAIGNLPSLEAGQDSGIKNHFARNHPQNHIECMKYTPTGVTAFKNEEHYPKKDDGIRIKGYNNSYKRMRWDVPTSTITMRNEIISSQENVHPGRDLGNGLWSDARVLTLRELLIVSSLPAELEQPTNLTETAFRQLIGEGIPPLLMKNIMKGIGK